MKRVCEVKPMKHIIECYTRYTHPYEMPLNCYDQRTMSGLRANKMGKAIEGIAEIEQDLSENVWVIRYRDA